MRIPEIGTVVAQAERAEGLGWDGITFTDSQNLIGDPFVAVALAAAATERLRFATGVTNAFTRHPAALANVAATVQETSGGRFVLGIGRGDTAMFHLGRKPMPVDAFIAAVTDLQTYLANGTVDCGGHPSRLHWLDRCRQPKVPLESLQAVSRHIQVLVRTGLIQQERTGRISRCSLDAGPMLEAAVWMNRYSKYWQQQFDLLAVTLADIDERRAASPSKPARKAAKKRRPGRK